VQPYFNGFFGDFQRIGSFRSRHFFHVTRHNHGPILGRKGQNGALKRILHFAIRSAALWIVSISVVDFISVSTSSESRLVWRLQPLLASEGFMHCDPSEPCNKPRATLELPEVLIGSNVGSVFGFPIIVENATYDARDPLIVAAHEDLE